MYIGQPKLYQISLVSQHQNVFMIYQCISVMIITIVTIATYIRKSGSIYKNQ